VQRLIGQGAFGKVYYAIQQEKPVAVKVMLLNPTTKSKVLPAKEAMLSADLSHTNLIVTLQHSSFLYEDVGQAVEGGNIGEVWIILEWCDMGTLSSYCDRSRTSKEDLVEVCQMMCDICAGGDYLHSRGVVHGDLTGNNVLLKSCSNSGKRGYVCKICDFGLARVLEGACTTLVTSQLGTVTHMPPELFALDRESLRFTKKVDIYSLGMLLWQCIHGEYPYRGLTPPQIIIAVSRGTKPKFLPDVPENVIDMFRVCTSSSPSDRPTFTECLERFSALRDSLSDSESAADCSSSTGQAPPASA